MKAIVPTLFIRFDSFVEMLDHTNSYIRTRGIILIAANAKWDVDYKLMKLQIST